MDTNQIFTQLRLEAEEEISKSLNNVRVLYKYRGLNKYTKTCLKEDKVWFSKYSSLNDSFDIYSKRLSISFSYDEAVDYISKRLRKTSQKLFEEFTALCAMFKDNSSNRNHLELFLKERFDELISSAGENALTRLRVNLDTSMIFCLSETCDNELMWAHYAGTFNGIVIGYGLTPRLLGMFNPVLYQDTLQLCSKISEFQVEDQFPKGNSAFEYAYYKKKIWQYEKEWRFVLADLDYINHKGALFRSPFPIFEIIFGYRVNPSQIKSIRDILDGKNIRFKLILPNAKTLQLQMIELH